MMRALVAVVTFVAASTLASAQQPAVSRAGREALLIDLISGPAPAGSSGSAAPTDTISLLAGREEVRVFVARARAARAAQLRACGRADQDPPTLGSAGNEWFVRLTCERPASGGAVSWSLAYAGGADGSVKRAVTLGSSSEVDAWLATLAAALEPRRPTPRPS